MDPYDNQNQNTPQWPPPNPHHPATFVPMPENAQQQPVPVLRAPTPVSMEPANTAPPAPAQAPAKLNTKPLMIASVAAAVVIILGTATALFWPKKQAPAPAAPATNITAQYYYLDEVQPKDGSKPASQATLGFLGPTDKARTITRHTAVSQWPFIWTQPLQLTEDGSHYVYATADTSQPGNTGSVPETYQLITGAWPQDKTKEQVLYNGTKRNDSREWLLTKDGKEVIYLDIVLDAAKNATTSDLYSVDVASGKSTRIGAIDRPVNQENTRLYETATVKDSSVRFYTSQDDGIYATRYNRKTRVLTNKKVVIRDYDLGSMGAPSPDGTKMLYYGVGKEDFTAYLLDLVEGGTTPLIATPVKYGAYHNGQWSPDSRQVALAAEIKDVDGKHYENQILTLDTVIKTKTSNLVTRNKSPDADNTASRYTLTSWSPDSTYLTYIQNGQINFYDLKNGKVIDPFNISHPIDPNAPITGWIQKPAP